LGGLCPYPNRNQPGCVVETMPKDPSEMTDDILAVLQNNPEVFFEVMRRAPDAKVAGPWTSTDKMPGLAPDNWVRLRPTTTLWAAMAQRRVSTVTGVESWLALTNQPDSSVEFGSCIDCMAYIDMTLTEAGFALVGRFPSEILEAPPTPKPPKRKLDKTAPPALTSLWVKDGVDAIRYLMASGGVVGRVSPPNKLPGMWQTKTQSSDESYRSKQDALAGVLRNLRGEGLLLPEDGD